MKYAVLFFVMLWASEFALAGARTWPGTWPDPAKKKPEAAAAPAAESVPLGNTTESEFKLEEGLVEKMYQDSVQTETGGTFQRSSIILIPSLSFLTMPEIKLSNEYFVVPYKNLGSIPIFNIEAVIPLLQTGSFGLMATIGAGYSYKEGVQEVEKTTPGDTSQGIVKLHWAPVYAGARMKTALFGVTQVKPHILGRAGMQWLYQSGTLDGLERGFWIPFFDAGAGLSLFENDLGSSDSWFGGLNLSVVRHEGLSSEQTLKSWMFEAGLQVWL